MNDNGEDQDIKGLLREAYQAPSPDPAFVRVLGERLAEELADTLVTVNTRRAEQPPGPSHPARRWRWIAVPAAAAAVVLLAVSVYCLRQHGDSDRVQDDRNVPQANISPEKKGSPEQPQVFFNKVHQPALERQLLRERALEQRVTDAQVIVVATALDSAPAPPKRPGDLPERLIRFRVTRVLKGNLADKVITTRTPTAADEFIGKEWVILLSPEYMVGKHQFADCNWIKAEPEVKAILRHDEKNLVEASPGPKKEKDQKDDTAWGKDAEGLPPLIKQPTYQSKTPKYAVLVFGPKADKRVWVVLDLAYDPLREKPGNKDSLYIDLNGNGDLTDPGERIPVEVITSTHFDWIAKRELEQHLPQFKAGDIVIRDGKIKKYTGLTVDVGWFVGGQRYRWVTLKVNVPGRGTQSVSSPLLRFADKPADASVIHFDGPLALRLNMSTGILHCPVDYTGKQEAAPPWYEEAPLIRGKECDLTAEIGTSGVGPGTFALMTANIPPSDAHPIAEVEFRHRDPAKPAILVKVELTQRCCATLFKGKVRVPEDAAAGKTKVSLSFPGWADGNVSSTDAQVTVVDPPNANSPK